ncbi:MAG: FtsW/RodA/SpoVE family cell cycle protein [Gemmatimonadales bacterium]
MSTPSVRHPGEFRWETRLLAVVTLTLTGFGVANCLAAGTYLATSYREATQQALAALVGGVIFIIAAYTDYQLWRRLAKPLLYATIAGLIVLAIPAVIWRKRLAPGFIEAIVPLKLGARRWLRLGIQLQISEIARFTLAAWVSMRLAEMGTKVRSLQEGFLPIVGVIAATAGLVLVEPSVTMAVVLTATCIAIVFTAGARIPHLLAPVAVGFAGLAAIMLIDPVRAKRLLAFSEPCAAIDQVCNSLIGIGSGGITGLGFGRGSAKLGHLPFSYSDFLFSVVAEEWGFVGVIFVGICFGLFCWMGFRIAKTARDPFGTFLASGITLGIGVSAFMHAAVVTNLMPATGLTLPFMSAGRVSLILCLFSAGVLVSIGRRRGRPAREK